MSHYKLVWLLIEFHLQDFIPDDFKFVLFSPINPSRNHPCCKTDEQTQGKIVFMNDKKDKS